MFICVYPWFKRVLEMHNIKTVGVAGSGAMGAGLQVAYARAVAQREQQAKDLFPIPPSHGD